MLGHATRKCTQDLALTERNSQRYGADTEFCSEPMQLRQPRDRVILRACTRATKEQGKASEIAHRRQYSQAIQG